MAAKRQVILADGEYYHIFNRGVEKRTIFTDKREYQRALKLLYYYHYTNLPLKFSRFNEIPIEEREKILEILRRKNKLEVQIIAYCLMPNHFHFLLRQEREKGIANFVSNFSNSYSKYFNTKHDRVGPLFQGVFKAVRVETDAQLLHLSRYIHLNPISSFLIKEEELDNYPWSSLPEYLGTKEEKVVNPAIILSRYKNIQNYRQFVHDQISYAQNLEKIKHLTLELEE
ncbi:transposase [Candidatus Gottesmanbacteria bacterium]|nr:transposase [Candidatus Gottesmanbacteria bacterium]